MFCDVAGPSWPAEAVLGTGALFVVVVAVDAGVVAGWWE